MGYDQMRDGLLKLAKRVAEWEPDVCSTNAKQAPARGAKRAQVPDGLRNEY